MNKPFPIVSVRSQPHMNWTWRFLFLLLDTTGKCPWSQIKKESRSSQGPPSVLLCPQEWTHRCSCCTLGMRWGNIGHQWRFPAIFTSIHQNAPDVVDPCTTVWIDENYKPCNGNTVYTPKFQQSGPDCKTCSRTQTTWKWAIWELKTQPWIAMKDTVITHILSVSETWRRYSCAGWKNKSDAEFSWPLLSSQVLWHRIGHTNLISSWVKGLGLGLSFIPL